MTIRWQAFLGFALSMILIGLPMFLGIYLTRSETDPQSLFQSEKLSSEEEVWFLTFAEGRFASRRPKIRARAETFAKFDQILVKGFQDLDTKFKEKYEKWLRSNVKGFGYWIWKPYFILETLKKMAEGDILFYMDGGCTLNQSAMPRFKEYLQLVRKNAMGILGFDLGLPEREWTKNDTAQTIGATDEMMESGQILSGIIFFRKCPASVALVKDWLHFCTVDNLRYSVDSPEANEIQGFKEHRHDQSIFSLLFKKAGGKSLPDETYGEWDDPDMQQKPIWATRRRS